MPTDSPSQARELALSKIADRLGCTKTADERYNNGFAHHTLAPVSSFIRAFEERQKRRITDINGIIVEAIPIKEYKAKEEAIKTAKSLIGTSINVGRGIFLTDMTLTSWIEKFYQESPSINKIARDQQVELATNGFAVPVLQQPLMMTDDDE